MFTAIKLFFTDEPYFRARMSALWAFMVGKYPVIIRVGVALVGYALHKNWIPTYIDGGGDTIGGILGVLAYAFPSSAGMGPKIQANAEHISTNAGHIAENTRLIAKNIFSTVETTAKVG